MLMVMFRYSENQIHIKSPEFSWDSNPRPSDYWSDALTTKPLGPLAEEWKTSYIDSIALGIFL